MMIQKGQAIEIEDRKKVETNLDMIIKKSERVGRRQYKTKSHQSGRREKYCGAGAR